MLETLVAFPTEATRPNRELVDWCVELARESGAAADVLPAGPHQANLLLRYGPAGPGGLLLAGHSDVVPAGEGWQTDPFRLTARGDSLIGRGAADMKGFLASALTTARARAAGLERPLYLAVSFDEEVGCLGVGGLLDHLEANPKIAPLLAVVGEPTSMRVCHRHAGKQAYDLRFRSQAAHSSRSRTMPSSASAAAAVAVAVTDVARRWPAGVTTNIGRIAGGTTLNVIAAGAELSFELRHGAGIDPQDVMADVWRAIATERERLATVDGDVEVAQTVGYPGLVTDPDEPACRLIGDLTGSSGPGAIEFGCEAGLYARVLPCPVVICGPGDIADAHRPDEWVSTAQLARCDAVLGSLVDAFAGVAVTS